eukprot:jgi/Antlo1/1578/2011
MRIAILYATQTGKSVHISRIIQRAIMFGYDSETLYNLERQERKHDVIVSDINNVTIRPHKSHIEILFYNHLEISWNLAAKSFIKVEDCIKLGNLHSNCRENVRMCFDFIVFVVSTHGDGAHPYSLSHFWNNFVSIPNFAVFGLGDSSYDKFNYCSKRLFNRLCMSHGVGFRRGEGDDQDPCGVYTGLRDWLGDLCAYIDELEHNKETEETDMCKIENIRSITENVQDSHIKTDAEIPSFQNSAEKMYQCAELVNKVFLTPKGYDRPVLELSFKVEKFCETISIVPKNGNAEEFGMFLGVESEWLRVLDFNREPCQQFFLHLHKFLMHKYIDSCNNRICYATSRDITTTDSSSTIELPYSNNVQHTEILNNAEHWFQLTGCSVPLTTLLARLWDIGTDYSLYFNYVVKSRRSLYSILKELNIKVDLPFLLENLSLIHPRYYTAINTENTCTIVVALQKNGLCSEYLKSMALGQRLSIGLHKRHVDISEKMCFVCTGTGISVPLSILLGFTRKTACCTAEEPSGVRTYGLRHRVPFLEINPYIKLPVIVYGFRYKEKDFLYKDILERLATEGKIILHTAVSRENREYVQDILARLDIKHHSVVVSGNAVLNKHIRCVLLDKKFQSETW